MEVLYRWIGCFLSVTPKLPVWWEEARSLWRAGEVIRSQGAGLKLLSGCNRPVGRTEPKRTCPRGRSERICRQRARPRQGRPFSICVRFTSHDAGQARRGALKVNGSGVTKNRREANSGHWAAEGEAAQRRPRAAKVVWPVRTFHQSTRKRRATARAICLMRWELAPAILRRAQMIT
jgi:hypothetical protein